jgi:hypothetical protein
MKNVYDGTVVLDRDGRAVVGLADWFEALNRDYRYQLTPIGGPAPHLHIVAEVSRPKTRDGTCILNSTTRSRSPASPVSARAPNSGGSGSTARQRPDTSQRARYGSHPLTPQEPVVT